MNALDVLWEYRVAFGRGLLTTGGLVVGTAFIGTFVAIVLEVICRFGGRNLRKLLESLAFAVAATPALAMLFWLHYPAQSLVGIVVAPFWTALATLALINICAVYRILNDALSEFPQQFIVTGLVCGLSRRQVALKIQLPLLLRATAPRWLDQQIIILHTSLFASLISVDETFRVAQRINSQIYRPVLIYTAMALLFLVTAGSMMYLARQLRDKFQRDFSEK